MLLIAYFEACFSYYIHEVYIHFNYKVFILTLNQKKKKKKKTLIQLFFKI